jgi:hypothetical protein
MISANYLVISLAEGLFKYENISRFERKMSCFDTKRH